MQQGKIHRLSPAIAERIAAGEIIERPASVVKELIENSLDAGATEIVVTLKAGGRELIEILDNGEGMSPTDLELCIERHATSKLSSLDDLEKIATLGFRGEALPSVAAVSDLTFLSRTKDSDTAYILNVGDLLSRPDQPPKSEKITFGQFIDKRHGTKIQARGLFSQIPARLKFLKSQSAEVSQTREWMERLALAFPQVGFKLISDEKTVLNLKSESEKSRIQSILSDGEDYPIQMITNEQDGFRDLGLKMRLYWLQGLSCSNARKLIQIVNSRAVRDRLLQQAILSPFRQTLLPGQFPAVVLFVDINPAAIDVNVHPTKSEIRFLNTQKIFSTLDGLIKSLITREGAPAIVPSSTESSRAHLEPYFQNNHSSFSQSSGDQGPRYSSPSSRPYSHDEFKGAYTPSLWGGAEPTATGALYKDTPTPFTLSEPQNIGTHFLHLARPVGLILNTYILLEGNQELILVDQHAAHERIRYENLKKRILGTASNLPKLASQSLLIPETAKFSPDLRSLVESRLPQIAEYGFESEIFGEDTLLFRSVPVEWGTSQLKTRLKNLVDRLVEIPNIVSSEVFSEVFIDEQLFEAVASEACHSAIRAGDRLEPQEVQSLIEQLLNCEHPWNCPHGRPTIAKVSQGKIEEWFQRRV